MTVRNAGTGCGVDGCAARQLPGGCLRQTCTCGCRRGQHRSTLGAGACSVHPSCTTFTHAGHEPTATKENDER